MSDLEDALEHVLGPYLEHGSFVDAMHSIASAIERIADTIDFQSDDGVRRVHVLPILFSDSTAGADALKQAVGLEAAQLRSLVAKHDLRYSSFDGCLFVRAEDVVRVLKGDDS